MDKIDPRSSLQFQVRIVGTLAVSANEFYVCLPIHVPHTLLRTGFRANLANTLLGMRHASMVGVEWSGTTCTGRELTRTALARVLWLRENRLGRVDV